MTFRFVVNVSVNRTQGKFASREEIEQQIQEALEGADPGSYEGENGGEYETDSWEVECTDADERESTRKRKPQPVGTSSEYRSTRRCMLCGQDGGHGGQPCPNAK